MYHICGDENRKKINIVHISEVRDCHIYRAAGVGFAFVRLNIVAGVSRW